MHLMEHILLKIVNMFLKIPSNLYGILNNIFVSTKTELLIECILVLTHYYIWIYN